MVSFTHFRCTLLMAGVFSCLTISTPVLADLRVDEGAEILRASKHDTTLTDHEKLYVYRCEIIQKYVGFPDNPIGQAKKYSCDQPHVGIAFYAGNDLGEYSPDKIAKYIEDEFKKNSIAAKVFIKNNDTGNSAMGFYVNGESMLANPITPSDAVQKIEGIAADSLMLLYTKGKIKEWPKP